MDNAASLFYPILHWFVSALALLCTAYFVEGFKVKDFKSALLASLVIGVANILVRPILLLLTLPLNLLTLGLFTFVVNGIVLKLCSKAVPGFNIKDWSSAIFGALILAIVGTLLHG